MRSLYTTGKKKSARHYKVPGHFQSSFPGYNAKSSFGVDLVKALVEYLEVCYFSLSSVNRLHWLLPWASVSSSVIRRYRLYLCKVPWELTKEGKKLLCCHRQKLRIWGWKWKGCIYIIFSANSRVLDFVPVVWTLINTW